MMREPISIMTVKCSNCHSEVVLKKIYVDFQHCSFLIDGECITCGKEKVVELSLEDFIDIDKIVNGGGR